MALRIIAGRYRRRKLRTNPGDNTRPITDFAKETLFENLGGELDGERVLDAFAGTGTMGLESLSRGASGVVFIEHDANACELLKKNCDDLGIADEVFYWRTDILRCSFRPRGEDHRLPYDLVFFDPPYKMASLLEPGRALHKCLRRLGREEITAETARLILRVPEHTPVTLPEEWQLERELEISSMLICLCIRRAATA